MKNKDNNIDADVIRTYVLQNVSTKPKKIHLFDKLRTGGVLEIGKEIYYALLDLALKLIPVTTRSQVLLFFTLSLGAVKMQGQHRDGQTANTLKTVTVDNYLDDHQWTTIPAADREAGLCIQDRATSSSLGADINNAEYLFNILLVI